MNKKLILIEFNELTHELMDEFINAGYLPNFKKFYRDAQVYTTDAGVSGEELNPWVQWVTLHTGLTPSEHGVLRLNEAADFTGEFIWDNLSRAGLKSWVCGSMNTNFKDGFNGMLVPDPWSAATAPYPPDKFEPYFDFIQQSVQGFSSKKYVSSKEFVLFMLKNGLSLSTIFAIIKQLLTELKDDSNKWKRASLMDWIQFDLFLHHFNKQSPDFSTFFLNSTAHYQHHYWSDMDPERFGKSKGSERNEKKEAILHGYRNMDSILGKFMQLADKDTVLVFSTALSQQPYVSENPEEERHYFHIIDEKTLAQKLQINQNFEYVPVMAEQFHLECESVEEAKALHEYLDNFHMQSNQYFHVGSNQVFLATIDENKVYVQCRCTKPVESDAHFVNGNNNETIPFYDVFYHMEDVKSGMHNPLGMLWILDDSSQHEVHKENMELEKVMPLIESYFSESVST